MQDQNQSGMTDGPAVDAYFRLNPRAAREQVEAAAGDAGLSLNEYCRVLMSLDAVKSICVQSVGVALSIIEGQTTGTHTLRNAEVIVEDIWQKNNDATRGLDVMAARIIREVFLEVWTRLNSFLEMPKSEDLN